jgi:flavin reductase (DIM6/NTAB) family NADH-FMN oxidoreductase RutF
MSDYLSITPGEIKTKFLHAYLLGAVAPRPIAFASTISRSGLPNLAPFSFFNVFSSNPPTLIFSPARRVRDNSTKHTLQNVIEVPEVVVNVVSHSMVEQVNLASTEYADGINEFEKAGFTPLASERVRPFRVAESPVQMECKVVEIKPLGGYGGAGQLIFARVLKLHIHRAVLDAEENIDPHKIDLVARMGANYYARASGAAVFEVEKPLDVPGIGIDALPLFIRHSHHLTGNELGRLGNVQALPDKGAVEKWWAEHGARFGAPDVEILAKESLRNGDKETALYLLLKPLLTQG